MVKLRLNSSPSHSPVRDALSFNFNRLPLFFLPCCSLCRWEKAFADLHFPGYTSFSSQRNQAPASFKGFWWICPAKPTPLFSKIATGWAEQVNPTGKNILALSQRVGIHEEGAISPHLGKEALVHFWRYPLQTPKALTSISWPLSAVPPTRTLPAHSPGKWVKAEVAPHHPALKALLSGSASVVHQFPRQWILSPQGRRASLVFGKAPGWGHGLMSTSMSQGNPTATSTPQPAPAFLPYLPCPLKSLKTEGGK